MNFLAHYYLDRHHPSSVFAIGAATPDLLSIYNERFRVKKHHLNHVDTKSLSQPALQLVQGINRHFEADDAFHSSAFFSEETKFINLELKKWFNTNSYQRKFFIAHVLLELILDKILIKNNPEILSEYYQHYSNAFPFTELRLATEKIVLHELPNYEHFLEKFLQNRYLIHYSEWDHIIYVLRRILRRAGVDHPDFLEDPGFIAFLERVQNRLENSYTQAFKQMSHLHNPK